MKVFCYLEQIQLPAGLRTCQGPLNSAHCVVEAFLTEGGDLLPSPHPHNTSLDNLYRLLHGRRLHDPGVATGPRATNPRLNRDGCLLDFLRGGLRPFSAVLVGLLDAEQLIEGRGNHHVWRAFMLHGIYASFLVLWDRAQAALLWLCEAVHSSKNIAPVVALITPQWTHRPRRQCFVAVEWGLETFPRVLRVPSLCAPHDLLELLTLHS